MSQHQQQPESENIEPQTPPTPETSDNGESEVASTSDMTGEEAIPSPPNPDSLPLTLTGGDAYPTAKSTEKQKLGLFKIVAIKILRGTIWLLEKIVEKLEGEAVRISNSTAKSAEAIAESTIDTTIAEPELGVAVPVSDTSTPQSTVAEAVAEVKQKPRKPKKVSTLAKVGKFWRSILSTIRSLLPRKWHEKLSDLVLTSAIAGIAVILILSKVALAPKTAETPTQIVTQVPSESIETPSQSPEETTPEEVSQPVETSAPVTSSTSVETTPEEAATAVETSENVEVSEPAETASETIPEPEKTTSEAIDESEETTPEAVDESEETTSEAVDETLPVESVAPAPVELTPEERIIANIQNQLTEITDEYTNGLIQSIQANFRGSFLVVTISNAWYELNESQQNKLGNAILNQAKNLDFSKLEIINSAGNLIARSPVIGSHLIIFQ
ncbi:hypothetical protein [Limnofasciculus baicalensis]|uniref:Uncharacterized protein n=1 Tax=Limnofasciculus baicalensis BBK-W-15 TaxID=2699891 RepID=A0AAE3GRY0_9CYAN|nr:hypothetical protein [Limnofasciculus baicalensis]MCP2729580.1 hypothetical protein [Limnofasciculus baicalensis BBK-W-15]